MICMTAHWRRPLAKLSQMIESWMMNKSWLRGHIQIFKLDLEKAWFRGTRNQIANIHWIIEKAREFQKNIYYCFTDYAKDFVDHNNLWEILQFSSVAQSCLTLSDPMDCSTPGFPVHHQLPELAQAHVHRVSDAIQPSYLSSPSPPAFNLSQLQGLFQWVSSSHQLAKVLEFQLQHQSFQWIFRTDFL